MRLRYLCMHTAGWHNQIQLRTTIHVSGALGSRVECLPTVHRRVYPSDRSPNPRNPFARNGGSISDIYICVDLLPIPVRAALLNSAHCFPKTLADRPLESRKHNPVLASRSPYPKPDASKLGLRITSAFKPREKLDLLKRRLRRPRPHLPAGFTSKPATAEGRGRARPANGTPPPIALPRGPQ